MDPTVTLILTRALERLLVVAVGALSLYIGYRLFAMMPLRKDGEGQLDFHGVSIKLSRVGPGVFFGLFGAAIIVYCASPISFKLSEQALDAARQATTVQAEYLGFRDAGISALSGGVAPPAGRMPRETVIKQLNALAAKAAEEPTNSERLDATAAIREAKLSLMREIWDSSRWGDYEAFHRWVTVGFESGAPPSAEAGAFYRLR